MIDTCDALKKELNGQFLPFNIAWVAWEAMKKLRHIGSMRDYVKEFSSLLFNIKKYVQRRQAI